MTIVVTSSGSSVVGYNYGLLKAAIANRLSRTNLTSIIPDFIMLAEARIYHGFRDIEIEAPKLRIQQMIEIESTSLASLPDGYLETSRFTVPDSYGTRALQYKTPQEFADLPSTSETPLYYTFQDGGVAVEGGTPVAFTFSYYRRFESLVADADTNWLLTNHPGIYLYSALIEAYAHIKDDARIIGAARMYAGLVNGLIDSDNAAKHSGSVLCIPSGR